MERKMLHWDDIKEKIKAAYPHLTEEDLYYEVGKEEELLKRLQAKLLKNEDEIRDWLKMMG